MNKLKYQWKRFWCPRDGGVIDLSDNGFLSDPESDYYKYTKSDVVPFDNISSKQCLVLLGEPGIGKSTAINDEYHRLEVQLNDVADKSLFFDLSEYGIESRLIEEIFNSHEFSNWKEGDHNLHLFLDSLDECKIKIPQLAMVIKKQLEKVKCHLPRLHLRITCRTADWPNVLEESLPSFWRKENYGIFELAPLRRKDVEVAAKDNGFAQNPFIDALMKIEVVPLAIKPVTLEFLIDSYKQDGKLPSSKIELYDFGCNKLCEESNSNRQDLKKTGGTGAMSVAQRFALAGKLAAVSIFCRKLTIYAGTMTIQKNPDVMTVSEFIGNNNSITEDNIKEVLGTGLFTSRGSQKFGFAHQTYAEFLAANYVIGRFKTKQIESLLFYSLDADKNVVPQLYETASWLASMNKNVIKSIASTDPQILLRGDSEFYSDDDKSIIVDSMLDMLKNGKINTRDWSLYKTYYKLKHPGLPEQLKSYIEDKTLGWRLRYDVIHIAESCELEELQDLLVDISLDLSEDINVRDAASHAIQHVGNEITRKKLFPLFFGTAGEDPDDQLKGNALRALWPDVIDAKTLFENLTLPKREMFHGSYQGFLLTDLIENLKTTDIPYALEWLERLINSKKLPYILQGLADDIMVLAYENIEHPDVIEPASRVCQRYLTEYRGIIHESETITKNDALFNDANKRHVLVEKILIQDNDFDKYCHGLTYDTPRLIIEDDLQWLLSKVQNADSEETASRWSRLVSYVYNINNAEHCKLIVDAAVCSKTLRTTLGLEPMELDSERAIKLKGYYYDAKIRQEKNERKPEKLEWLPTDRILHWIEQYESGSIDAWYGICRDITLEDTSKTYKNSHSLDISIQPGWQKADQASKQRILNCAEGFLRQKPCDPFKWIRKPDSWSRQDIASNKAFGLLKKASPDKFNEISQETWRKWTPALLGAPHFDDDNRQICYELAKEAYQKKPKEFIFSLQLLMDAENAYASSISVHEKLELCWDEHLCDAVLEKVQQPYITTGQHNSFKSLLSVLIKQSHQPSIEYAKSFVQHPWPDCSEERKKICEAAIVLAEDTEDSSWDIVWPAMQDKTDFGREFMLQYSYFNSYRQADVLSQKLNEDAIADLYIWLVKQFPHSEDPQHDGAFSSSRRDMIARLRDSLLRVLENLGTIDSFNAVGKIVNELPDIEWLKTILVETKRNALHKNWQPMTLESFLKLCKKQENKKRIFEFNPNIWGMGLNLNDPIRQIKLKKILEIKSVQNISRLMKKLRNHCTSFRTRWQK